MAHNTCKIHGEEVGATCAECHAKTVADRDFLLAQNTRLAERQRALQTLAWEAMERLDWWQSTFYHRAEAGVERAALHDTRSLIDRLRELLEGRKGSRS